MSALIKMLLGLTALAVSVFAEGDAERIQAGLEAKRAGHRFENQVADHLSKITGDTYKATGSAHKADLVCEHRNFRVSLKNASRHHTQIALLGQDSVAELLQLDDDGRAFVTLFFGLADGDPLEPEELKPYGLTLANLSDTAEIRRNRLLYASIPTPYRAAFEKALNQDRKQLFLSALVAGDANWFGWASQKNDPTSVRYYRVADLLARLNRASWQVAKSQSTFHLLDGDRKYMHMQMKGSSKRYSAGYHSIMIHVYDELLKDLPNHPTPTP